MSSSGTTEPATSPPGVTRGSRRTPAILVVAGVLAVLLIVGGVLALLGQGSSSGPPPQNVLVGTRLQSLHLPALERVDASGRLAATWWRPHGAVLLFFAHWCTPCRAEVPRLARALGRGDVSGVRVIGFDGDDSKGVAAAFVTANHVRFPVVYDSGLAVASALVPEGFPAAVFVRPSGKVVAVDYGSLSIIQLDAGLSMIGKPT